MDFFGAQLISLPTYCSQAVCGGPNYATHAFAIYATHMPRTYATHIYMPHTYMPRTYMPHKSGNIFESKSSRCLNVMCPGPFLACSDSKKEEHFSSQFHPPNGLSMSSYIFTRKVFFIFLLITQESESQTRDGW